MTTPRAWTTADEILFLRDIGRHSEALWANGVSKFEMLSGYLKGWERRARWAGLDAPAIHAEVRRLIRLEMTR